MDDFIHNLRTNKRFDRNRKPHDGKYPGSDKQRHRDSAEAGYLKSIVSDHIPAFNKTMEGFADSQKRLADAVERRAKAEERKADAMESIAAYLKDIAAKGKLQNDAEKAIPGSFPEKETAPKRKPRVKAQPLQIV